MKFSCIPLGLVLSATLSLASSQASAAGADLRALSDTEMSAVYGRGLTEPTLSALGALITQEQSGSAVPAVTATDALAALGALPGDGAQDFDRRMMQQRLATTVSIESNLKIAQTVAALNAALAPINAGLSLPVLPFGFLFTLPSLDALQKKH